MEMEMEMEEEQQQPLHSGVVDGIARLADPRYREERHKLCVDCCSKVQPVDRRSLEHLAIFLENHRDAHEVLMITELVLFAFRLSPDGGFECVERLFCKKRHDIDKSLTDRM
jgi:hypothetical protein